MNRYCVPRHGDRSSDPWYEAVGIAGLVLSAIVLGQSASFAESWLLVGVGWMIILVVSGLWALRQSVLSFAESSSD